MRRPTLFTGAVLLIGSFSQARADVIYSTYHPEKPLPNSGTGIAAFDGSVGEQLLGFAERIYASDGTFRLDTLTVAVFPVFNGSGATFAILADNNDAPAIESFSITEINNFVYLLTANSVLHPLLPDGTFYWVAGFVPSAAEDMAWITYPGAADAPVAIGPYQYHDGHWHTLSSTERIFALQGTLVEHVPEPRMSIALALILVCIAVGCGRAEHG